VRLGARYRAGPWPGLTPTGAGALLACAGLLAGGQFLVGAATRPLPDLPIVALAVFVPLVLATRITRIPGAAVGACGAYLLPRTLASVVNPSIDPPALLLVPTVAFELLVWVQSGDVSRVWWRTNTWRRRARRVRNVERRRVAVGGAAFGLVFAVTVPPMAILIGANPVAWSGWDQWLATVLCAIVCAAMGSVARSTAA
jgi:hypothetical protein